MLKNSSSNDMINNCLYLYIAKYNFLFFSCYRENIVQYIYYLSKIKPAK